MSYLVEATGLKQIMITFDAAHGAVHHPADRRFRIWIRPSILIGAVIVVLSLIVAAWIEVAAVGMPSIPPVPQIYPSNFAGPHGFPLWVGILTSLISFS